MFDIVILIGAICGPIMVIGSMILLYRGSISLQAVADDKDALSIEIIKEIKFSTRYPALALFFIGFIFFAVAAKYAQEGDIRSILLEGIVSSPDDLVNVELHLSAGPWKRDVPDQSGKFSMLFHPNVTQLRATVFAPGYERSGVTKIVSFDQNTASIGTMKLGKRVSDIPRLKNIPDRQDSNNSITIGRF